MSIETTIQGLLVINRPTSGETLKGIGDYVTKHIAEWSTIDVLWDLTSLDMMDISPDSIRSFAKRMQKLSHFRTGRKSALVCPNDLCFGMMRMFCMLIEDSVEVKINVVRSIDEGLKWITAQQDSAGNAGLSKK